MHLLSKKLFCPLLAFYALINSATILASEHSIFLVRHAEKQANVKNPELTQCGEQRAQQIAKILTKSEISKIYSTNYARTLATATPSAKAYNLAIEHYDPRKLADFAKQLTQAKQNALVVGHSNTTPMLVNYLTDKNIAPLSEQQYSYLFHVSIIDNKASVTTLIQAFECHSKDNK